MNNNPIKLSEPSRENLRQIGRDALISAFRKESLRCTHRYGLTADDINDAACTVAHEIDTYQAEDKDAA